MSLTDRVLARYIQAHAIQRGTRLFHRSHRDFKVGDIIEPGRGGELPSWQYEVERYLEQVRKEEYPQKLSRRECVYTSVVPRARFTGRGKLYVVEPMGGKTHVADSRIIDQLHYSLEDVPEKLYPRLEGKKLGKAFWESDLLGAPLADVEVMLERAVVVEVVGDDAPLEKGDQVTFGSGVSIPVKLQGEENWKDKRTYYRLGHMRLTTEDAVDRLTEIRGIQVVDYDNSLRTIDIELGSGFTGVVTFIRGGEPGQSPKDDTGFPLVEVEPLRKAAPVIRFTGLTAGAFWRALHAGRITVR